MKSTATGTGQLEDTFRAAIDAYTAQDAEALLSLFSEDGVIQDMADPERSYEGKDALRAFLAEYFSALDDVEVELTSVAVGDDVVTGEVDVRANYVAAPFSVDVPRPVRLRYGVVDAFRGGKIVRERYYWDSSSLEKQLQGGPGRSEGE